MTSPMRARGHTSLVLAAALHGALAALVVFLPLGASRGPVDPTTDTKAATDEVPVDITDPEARAPRDEPLAIPSPTEPRLAGASAQAKLAPSVAATPLPPSSVQTQTDAPAPDATTARSEPREPESRVPWTMNPSSMDLDALGVGARNPFLLATGNAQTAPEGASRNEAPSDRGGERALRSALHDRDRSLGLGSAGPVIAAVESLARTSVASVESRAVFDVIADRDGNVTSVTLSDVSEDRAGWARVAAALMAAMRGQKLRVPPGSRGVAMSLEVLSREQMPSGASPGVHVTLFDQSVKDTTRGKGPKTAIAVLPLARIQLPGGKQLVLPIPLPLIGGVGDPADIGVQAQRVVHAHVLEERDL